MLRGRDAGVEAAVGGRDGLPPARTAGIDRERPDPNNQNTVFFEQTDTGYSAHVPDLPGCVAAGATLEETRQLIREGIGFHMEAMRLHGETIPEPTTLVEQVEIPA
ncbi:MAG: type II toxin-antitoxin system HicB family antitoxin [Acidobacteriia bacterium]|nr:type II toxin-antitoxin system HicB family antitoxin [Terriglobia bacterium]